MTFYEIHILLDSSATHIIEGNVHALQQYDIVLLAPYRLHMTQYPAGPPHKRLIINFNLPRNTPGLETAYNAMLQPFAEEVPIYRFTGGPRSAVFEPLNAIFQLLPQRITAESGADSQSVPAVPVQSVPAE
ncbi:hypothetical protein ACFSQ7_39805 [Paenibacillus rhizoplanae]